MISFIIRLYIERSDDCWLNAIARATHMRNIASKKIVNFDTCEEVVFWTQYNS